MKLGFQFSNLLGVVYKKGNIQFTADGHFLLVPVGSRVSVYDLINSSSSFTMPYDHKNDIKCIAISQDSTLMLSVDEEGHAVLVSFMRRSVLHRFRLDAQVTYVKFSPDSSKFAVCLGKSVQVWKIPTFAKCGRSFAPLSLLQTVTVSTYENANWIDWSESANQLIAACSDMTVKVVDFSEGDENSLSTLSAHRDVVVASWYVQERMGERCCEQNVGKKEKSQTMLQEDYSAKQDSFICSVGRDGSCFFWHFNPETNQWSLSGKCFFNQERQHVTCASFCKKSLILTVGFSSGLFHLYEIVPGDWCINKIHELSIATNAIHSIDLNSTGEWIAFASKDQGQLVVWEWQSEVFILKQQGHFSNTNCIDYSPDGELIVTGGEDGKVKIWNTKSSYSFITFSEHLAPVTRVCFAKNATVVLSASKDGTVRAFDLVRYRNFRTFTTPSPVQFSCLAVDSSGELVAAGCSDSYEVYIWSMTTSAIVEVIGGHEGPLSQIAFDPMGHLLVTASWDKTVRLWDVYSDEKQTASWSFPSEVQALTYSPDGKKIIVSLLNGDLSVLIPGSQIQQRTISARWDISGGRHYQDKFTAANSTLSKYFTCLSFSPDSALVIGGGNSKWICLYDVEQGALVKKWASTRNKSIDGVQDKLNSRFLRADGINVKDLQQQLESIPDPSALMPGVASGDFSKRKTLPAIRTTDIKFSPAGRAWAASTTEGVLIFSLDRPGSHFDPIDFDTDITPQSMTDALKDKKYTNALLIALRLNEDVLVFKVLNDIPIAQIATVSSQLPTKYLRVIFEYIAKLAESSRAVERTLEWMQTLLFWNSKNVSSTSSSLLSGAVLGSMRRWKKNIEDVRKVVNDRARGNLYAIKYLLSIKDIPMSH